MVDKSIIVHNLRFRTGDITGLINEIGKQFGKIAEVKSILLFLLDKVNFTLVPGTFVVEYADVESARRSFTERIQLDYILFNGNGQHAYYKNYEFLYRKYQSIRYGIFSVYL